MQALNEERLSPDKTAPYILQYYGAHLERAQCQPTAFLTLVSNGWKKAWEKLEGTYAGFLSNVDRAWRVIEDANQRAAEDNRPIPYIGGEVRCALCHTSIHSLAANLPPAFLVALVEKNILTPVQAWNYAHHTTNQGQREEIIVGLAPHLPESLIIEAFEEALTIEKNSSRAEALLALLPQLSDGFKEAAFREALQAAQQTDNDFFRARLLVRLAPYERQNLQEVLQRAYAIKDDFSRTEALRELARHVPGEAAGKILQDALHSARSIGDKFYRVEALVALSPQLPGNLKEKILLEALDTVPGIANDSFMAEVLVGMASHLTEGAYRKALEVARTIQEESYQVRALVGLASHRPQEVKRQILHEVAQIIRTISGTARIEALTYLGHYLKESVVEKILRAVQLNLETSYQKAQRDSLRLLYPEIFIAKAQALATEAWARLNRFLSQDSKEKIATESLRRLQEINDEVSRASAVVVLAPYLPPSLHEEALRIVETIEDEKWRGRALGSLSSYLGEPLLRQALQNAITIGDGISRAEAAQNLAQQLAGKSKQHVVNRLSRGVQSLREAFLDDKAPASKEDRHLKRLLSKQLRQEALREVLKIRDARIRCKELAALIPLLPQDVGLEVLRQELRRASLIKDSRRKVQAMELLVACLPESLLDEALKIARDIEDDLYRAEALSIFIPRISSSRKDQIIEEILHTLLASKSREKVGGIVPIKVLESIVKRVSSHVSVSASHAWLEVTNKFESPLLRVTATVTLSSCLPPEPKEKIMSEMLEFSETFLDPRAKALAFTDLAPHLHQHQKEKVLCEALQMAGKIEDEGYRVSLLGKLAPHLTKLPVHILYPAWWTILHVLATRTRRAFVNDLATLSPVVLALGGSQAIEESIQAIEDVGKWWP